MNDQIEPKEIWELQKGLDDLRKDIKDVKEDVAAHEVKINNHDKLHDRIDTMIALMKWVIGTVGITGLAVMMRALVESAGK